ncbi:Ribosome-releasing factor 2, mitochondrial [Tieghemiomyces parasiticus]|uniref:Elongation factor 2 n=1 Tax=Tieghemiomyces parasiticus TaxID=78921 RepID=A0A9W8AHB1_9FUNG|nr:Ribosome-releasing factor 2, mitochondrial [Tieghemiomyces parasiticus]
MFCFISRLDVDDGDTVMDYMQQERERGITIQSAAITFGWRDAQINLIDTPGHVDFTFEVERSIRVLDGAVVIIDGVTGVQAQTETVWRQADRYRLPRLVFVNKLDRVGGGLDKTLHHLRTRFPTAIPLVCQLPLVRVGPHNSDQGGRWELMDQALRRGFNVQPTGPRGSLLAGVIDVVTQELLEFDPASEGSVIRRTPLTSETPNAEPGPLSLVATAARQARVELVEALAERDDQLMEAFLDTEDHLGLPVTDVQGAIRRLTLANRGVPVLCGSAYRNTGVQPLLDAVLDYLPSPVDATRPTVAVPSRRTPGQVDVVRVPFSDTANLCALAFKVIYDARRGPMVFVRVYSGTLQTRMTLVNAHRREKERVNKLLTMYANDVEEVPQIAVGDIGVILGLKHTRTGDTLLGTTTATAKTNAPLPKLRGVEPPPPVFFCSVEPASAAEEKSLNQALDRLLLEDPSLHVTTDAETGQTLLSGMGELHLEIVKDRLLRDYKVNAEVGSIRIAYRETVRQPVTHSIRYDREVLGKLGRVDVSVRVSPLPEADLVVPTAATANRDVEDGGVGKDNTCDITQALRGLVLSEDDDHDGGGANRPGTRPASAGPLDAVEVATALRTGINQALSRGPLLGFQTARVHVEVTHLRLYGDASSPAALRAGTAQAVRQALMQAESDLLEPMMDVAVQVPRAYVGVAMSDLSGARRARVSGMTDDGAPSGDQGVEGNVSVNQIIHAQVPLSALLGYSSALRSLTAGTGTFTMQLVGYGTMTSQQKKLVMKETRGYE